MAAIPGPPRRKVNKSPEKLTSEILACKAPTYYNVGKAWNILGYYQQERPELEDFVEAFNALWNHQKKLKTLKGRRARAYMIDALRTLRFRKSLLHTDKKPGWVLGLTVNDQDGSWFDLPDPPRGGYNYGKSDAREYLAAVAPRATPNEHAARGLIERRTLLPTFQLYYGFGDRDQPLRALPVPIGADSLWYSLSYFLYRRHRLDDGRPAGGPSIWRHAEVKARIWTYLMQVLNQPDHELWAQYHLLQHKSKTVDPDFGTLSMVRSLYASQSQGKPAYPHEFLLHVIADYFGTTIEVYSGGADSRQYDQGDLSYGCGKYGCRTGPQPNDRPTIRLASNPSQTEYSIVESDALPLHQTPGFSAYNPFPLWIDPSEIFQRAHEGGTPPPPFLRRRPTEAGPISVPPPRAVRPPCEHARYNYFMPGDRPILDAVADAEGVIAPQTPVPQTGYYEAGDGAANHVVGILPWRMEQERWGDVLLTTEVFNRFRAGIDVPGWGFAVPDAEVMDGWFEEAGGVMLDKLEEQGRRLGGRHMLDDPYVEFESDKWRVKPPGWG
ncbi:hypothetical protein B0I37DRAFT_406391 [Chaetomium sp. MPI-CAGE-AT-0009]|nr:hypothetical protein B0I37DRAFT_406391 [Chaetomium sp. MPI-CAGE-AT-0009]